MANSDLTETLRMEFSELKAEAYCSLGWLSLYLRVSHWNCYFLLVEILTEPSVYFAQELDEAIQVIRDKTSSQVVVHYFITRGL